MVFVCAYTQDPAYPAAPATAQNIIRAEYFIDTDPGIGRATSLSITNGTNITVNANNINTAGLPNGVHRIGIRTLNNEGGWSLTAIQRFIVDFDPAYPAVPATAQNIVAAEYFIDTDPGLGNANAITLTAAVDLNDIDAIVNTNGLANGIHRVYLRVRSQDGKWSMVNIKSFALDADPEYPAAPAAAPNVTAAEYFIDTDPGWGNGQPIAISAAANLVDVDAVINTNGLANGVHRLYIRTRSTDGKWSITNVKSFTVDSDPAYPAAPAAAQNIVAAEYFVDTDPGLGNGNAINISAGVSVEDVAATVDVSGLSGGMHRVYLRTRSSEGRWSITNEKAFEVSNDPSYPAAPAAAQNILAAEYFIDTDPGFGAAHPIAVTAGIDISNISANINTAGLSNGSHRLFIRTKSQEGKWSISNYAEFFTDMLAVTDTLSFGNVTVGTPVEREIVIKNNSNTTQTVTTVNAGAGVTTDAVTPISIPAGTSDTIKVTFNPTNIGVYFDSVVLTTSAGRYQTVLEGFAVAQIPSWSLSPATGHHYGNAALNSNNSFNFTIQNTGNIPITLSSAVVSNAAFVPTFTPGTVVPVNGSVTLPVVFTPTAVQAYSGQLKIKSSTAGIDSVTAVLNGNGYAPGTPPVLEYVPGGVFAGNSGVSPAAGQTGAFTYKILYKSPNNKAPMAGYPKVSVDINGDQDFNDLNEGIYSMTKEGNSNDYATGVVYAYTYTHSNNTSNAGYKFEVMDADGNTATAGVAYKAGPVVTNDVLDLRIFANDISFSMPNPAPGQTFTMTARISNSTAVPATNIPIKFYRDTILIGSDVLASVGAYGSSTINRSFNFPDEGFYPIKVWIDSSRTLNENNILNNYAIRPVTVGSPVLPGGITATTRATRQECPQLQVLIAGSAAYYGTGTNTIVAGAEVTITTGTQTFKTTTDANGNYSQLVTGVTCGSGNFAYAVTITDFTFTSLPASNSIPMPCPAPNACTPPGGNFMGGISGTTASGQCANVAGTTTSTNFVVKLRERNIANFWSGWDYINHRATMYIFHDEVLVDTKEYGAGLAPGGEIRENIPLPLPSGSTTPIKVTVLFSYTYVEFSQIPSSTHYGHFINITERAEVTVTPQPDLPDLTAQGFAQTSMTSFRFDVANTKCVSAGNHVVRVFDNGTLIKTESITSLGANATRSISYNDPNFAPGVHRIRVEVDADAEVTETDENNNVFEFDITVVAPDLTVTKVNASPTLLNSGTSTRFTATIRNTGKATGAFNVLFRANGVQIGAKKLVNGVGERDSVDVTSDAYVVTSGMNFCGEMIAVFADADSDVSESVEGNNSLSRTLSADLVPFQLPGETGAANNPAVIRINRSGNFFPAIRNMGLRDAANVRIRYVLNGVEIATDSIVSVKAGVAFAAHGAFSHMFDAVGNYTIQVIADPGNMVCEWDETNNTGTYHVRVVDSKPDLEVLSQYVSPSSLNPQPDQNITVVGTVRNSGGKVSTASVMRFYVDNVQLGNDVPFNAIQPGKDTTVQATLTYSSGIPGVKVMKIEVDPGDTVDEEIEWNNIATRTMIVGEAPDMARRLPNAIRFNPSGFSAGDSVVVSYSIINNGTIDGTAWIRFMILDEAGGLRAIDSARFMLAAGANTIIGKKMLFDIEKGSVVAEIVNCSPIEYDFYNNKDTLQFSTIAPLTRSLTVNANMDMTMGLPDDLPGWIGGKLLLGDYDLTINGSILNSDAEHFIVTNGTGKLKLVNNNTENIFPVAASESHGNFVKISNAGTPDNFSVRVVPWVLQGGETGDTVKTGNINRTWFIEEQTAGGSNATLQFLWNQADEQPAFDRLQSRTAHYTSSWQLGDLGAALQDSVGRYSKSQAGYTGFSPFTVTSINAALPLRLLEFKAVEHNGNAHLNWKTTDEVNTSHFIVEHSNNGRDFSSIGNVKAFNSNGVHEYQFRDAISGAGTHFYRLQMVDIDGTFTYSTVQKITVTKAIGIGAYPNPAVQNLTVTGVEAGGTLQMFTAEGKLVNQWIAAGNIHTITLGTVTKGLYIIRYQHKEQIQQLKFIKE